MANKRDYIAAIRAAIRQMHHCDALYSKTVHVHEVFQGRTAWDGDVEVFELPDHPKAKRCYAWAHLKGDKDEETQFVTILELPPVTNAFAAVKVAIAAQSKTPKS